MKTRIKKLMVTMITLAAVMMMTVFQVGGQGRTQRERSGSQVSKKADENRYQDQNKSGNDSRGNRDFYTRNPEYEKNNRGNKSDENYSSGKMNRGRTNEIGQQTAERNNTYGRESYNNKKKAERIGEINREGNYSQRPNKYKPENHRSKNSGDFASIHLNKHYRNKDYRSSRFYFYHPRYGHVVRRFEVNPMVFSYNRGHLFYSDGCFFRFLPEIGYVVVDYPYNYYFNELPYGVVRVIFRGKIYFSKGNLFFEFHRGGYRLVPFSRDIYHNYFPGQVYYSSRF